MWPLFYTTVLKMKIHIILKLHFAFAFPMSLNFLMSKTIIIIIIICFFGGSGLCGKHSVEEQEIHWESICVRLKCQYHSTTTTVLATYDKTLHRQSDPVKFTRVNRMGLYP